MIHGSNVRADHLDLAYREAATLSPSDAARPEVSPAGLGGLDEVTWQIAGCLRACLAPAIALTARSADEAGDDLARGPCEMPGDAAGPTTGAPAGSAGERTATDCAGLPVRSSAGRRAARGAGREGPGARGRWFLAAGAVTGRAVSCTIEI